MAGGLLQIVTSGKQDIYLTINPEITFFKKVYRRHTNFAIELREIKPEQPAEYNNIVSFIINNGDIVYRCYLEIELPNLSFSDKYITNINYINKKNIQIDNFKQNMNIWNDYYINLKGFIDIELGLYRNLYNYLQTDNITITTLKSEVTRFNFINKSNKDIYKNKIDESIYNKINMSGYISSINKLITNQEIYDNSIYISRIDIINQLNIMYNLMLQYLKDYNSKKIYYLKEIEELQKDNQINFNYAEYLGHNFFEYFTLEIGGVQIEKYSNDFLHINQMHYINENNMPNYLEMIGHTPKLNNFNNSIKGNTKLLVPLIFWFNKDAGSGLPLVSLQYSSIIINAKINEINKIVCFQNYEKMYDDIIQIRIENTNGFVLNKNLIYSSYKFNITDKSIIYNCIFINNELLKIKFPDLTDSEINIILENNGKIFTTNQITKILNPKLSDVEIQTINGINGNNTQYLIDKFQWVGLMISINKPIYTNIAPKIGSYYPYIDFNLYYSLISDPKVKLIAEMVYLDDIERTKFADSKLEYVVETFDENIFNIRNEELFDCELSFNNPCKEILWYIQPQIFQDSITEYGQNTSLLFNTFNYFINNPILKQKLSFNQLDVLLQNIDINYYTYLLSYKHYNNILPNGIFSRQFCLYSEETQPSGTVNLRHIKGKQYHIEINKQFLAEYIDLLNKLYGQMPSTIINNKKSLILKFISKNYDLFIVHKGTAKLLFTN